MPPDRLSLSDRTYLGLVAVLAALTAIAVFLPQGPSVPQMDLPAPKGVIALVTGLSTLVLYGGLGLAGLRLSQTVGFAGLWSPLVTGRQRFVIPALAGISIGIFFVLTDAVLSSLRLSPVLPHPPFPTSLVASVTAGIGEEAIFRLFLVSFGVWAISRVMRHERWKEYIFWTAVFLSACAFTAAHLPSILLLFGWKTMADIPAVMLAEIVILNGVLSIAAAQALRKHGFLAAASIHCWTDIVWHVGWGSIR